MIEYSPRIHKLVDHLVETTIARRLDLEVIRALVVGVDDPIGARSCIDNFLVLAVDLPVRQIHLK